MNQDTHQAPSNIMDGLWDAARRVHSPERLLLPGEIVRHLEIAKISHGVFGWWFDQDLAMVPRDGCHSMDGKHLLFAGKALPGQSEGRSRSPAENRLWGSHLRGSVRVSTLRLSLAALLADNLGLAFFRDALDRTRMSKADEDKLTFWLDRHAAISAVQHDDPRALERLIFTSGPSLPLRLEGSSHPFHQTLHERRSALGRGETD